MTGRDDATGAGSGSGTLSIVGIGPGLPDHLTRKARSTIANADAVYAAPTYQSFLAQDDGLPLDSEAAGPEIVDSNREDLPALARETFDRVRSGEHVVHVSGGDPNVYGKSDLLFALAEEEGATDLDVEVVPGVTAALGGAAMLGAPLSNDFCTVSLSDKWRDWAAIEEKLRAATEAGFVLAIYNGWHDLDRAVAVIRDGRADDAPIAILEDVGRGDAGRNPGGESATISTLGSVAGDVDEIGTPGMMAIVGTADTRVLHTDHGPYLVTPRGELDVTRL